MRREKLALAPPFDELLRRYQREVLRYLLRLTGNRDEAADLFQETWLRAYRAYPKLKPDSALRGWLYAIAVNLWRNRLRDGARRRRAMTAVECAAAAQHGAGEGDGYAAIRLRELMSELPARQREALELRCFAGLDYGEIARAMGGTGQSARANVSQAVKKIKRLW